MTSFRMIRTALSAGVAVIVVGLFSATILLPFRWIFFAVGIGWTAFFALLLRRLSRLGGGALSIVPLAITTTLASLALLTLVEWRPLQWFVIACSGALAALLTALTMGHHAAIVYEAKRVRRLFAMLWVFNAFAAATMLFALGIFFPHLPFWPFAVAGGTAFAAASYMIWRLYYNIKLRSHGIWVGIFAFIFTELMWAMHRLPFGPFATGALLTWMWYIGTLLTRFHFSAQGIVWVRQRLFLFANAAAYIAALVFFVRWV